MQALVAPQVPHAVTIEEEIAEALIAQLRRELGIGSGKGALPADRAALVDERAQLCRGESPASATM